MANEILTIENIDAIGTEVIDQITDAGMATDIKQGDKSVTYANLESRMNLINALNVQAAKIKGEGVTATTINMRPNVVNGRNGFITITTEEEELIKRDIRFARAGIL